VTLAEVGGRAQVVAMVYTHCTHTCPRIVGELKRLEAAVPAAARSELRFVLVSLDPERDTPARLAEYAASARLDAERWTLLTGGEEEVRELAALLGLRYRSEGNAEFSHSNSYLVLDGEGRIVHRQAGLGEDLAGPLAAIRAATTTNGR
jgi:protein SCO1